MISASLPQTSGSTMETDDKSMIFKSSRSHSGSERLLDRLAGSFRARRAAEIAGARPGITQSALDRRLDTLGGLVFAEMVEHHRARPDHADGIGDALPGDIRRGAMDRLEQQDGRRSG